MMVSTCGRTACLLIGEWLRLASRPLDWCHIYAPVAPARLALELLHCPAPYILGIARHTLRAARAVPPSDAVVVDLDARTVRAPADLKAMLSAMKDLVDKLLPILQPHYAACDSLDTTRTGFLNVLMVCSYFCYCDFFLCTQTCEGTWRIPKVRLVCVDPSWARLWPL